MKKYIKHFGIIVWQDASSGNSSLTEEEIDNCGFLLTSIGFIVKEDDKYITIAQEYKHSIRQWIGTITIPKSIIKNMIRSDSLKINFTKVEELYMEKPE